MVAARVTVLMPVYNAGPYLRDAIKSILAQSFAPFEFLIIDDGSTDSSAEIIESFRDPRIRFVRNPSNMGVKETLNKGISLASCELIARMDADDISNPHRLQKQFGYMKRNPQCALLSTWARVISEDNKFIRIDRHPSNFYYYNLTFECWMYHSTIMFRKSAVEHVGMYASPNSEGYDLFWRMSTRFRIANLPEALVDCRSTSTGLNTVSRGAEYEAANEQSVLRNIRYYLGAGFQISHTSLECLRHNFKPLFGKYDTDIVMEALAVLDAITQKIIEKDNINRDVMSIRRARRFKRNFMLDEIGKALPAMESVELLVRTRAWLTLAAILKNFVQWHIKQRLKMLRSYSSAARFKIFSSQAVKNS